MVRSVGRPDISWVTRGSRPCLSRAACSPGARGSRRCSWHCPTWLILWGLTYLVERMREAFHRLLVHPDLLTKHIKTSPLSICLLYTSDAADE